MSSRFSSHPISDSTSPSHPGSSQIGQVKTCCHRRGMRATEGQSTHGRLGDGSFQTADRQVIDESFAKRYASTLHAFNAIARHVVSGLRRLPRFKLIMRRSGDFSQVIRGVRAELEGVEAESWRRWRCWRFWRCWRCWRRELLMLHLCRFWRAARELQPFFLQEVAAMRRSKKTLMASEKSTIVAAGTTAETVT